MKRDNGPECPALPPVDAGELEKNVGRLFTTPRPAEGWPGKLPREKKRAPKK